MLATLTEKLVCAECRASGLTTVAFEAAGDYVQSGLLKCRSCRACFIIHDRLLELVPTRLRDGELRQAFVARNESRLRSAGIDLPLPPANETLLHADQLKQRDHFDWYAENATQTYADYQQTPFWRASDAHILARWRPLLKNASGWVLDIGCADGRGGFQLVREMPGATLVGFDISAKMARVGIERARSLGLERASFLVADGDAPPFRDETFDAVVTFGVLHHLPDPGKACIEIQRILKSGGVHFANENNKTALRPIFDWLMQVFPIWVEEAGAEPLMSSGMVRGWLSGSAAKLTWETSVFLPPHLFNAVGERAAKMLLEATDRVAHVIPLVKNQGGLIVFEVEKQRVAA